MNCLVCKLLSRALLVLGSMAEDLALDSKPNIIFILADDLGWNTAWNNKDIISPNLNALAADGLKLTSHYVYRYCSPTRAALLTGRSPYKLLNIRDNLRPEQVTDPRFTFLPKRLQEAGYYSYQIGKWHLGQRAPKYTPVGRGFSESYGFLAGAEDHFDSTTNPKCKGWGKVVDYFAQGGEYSAEGGPVSSCEVPEGGRETCPLFKVISANESVAKATELCSKGTFAHCAFDSAPHASTRCYRCFVKRYTGFDFASRAVHAIENHAMLHPNRPMFMYLALQNTHGPIEAPKEYVDMYHHELKLENTHNAMVSVIDSTTANVTAALRSAGMWTNTLLVWTTDNGSPSQVSGSNAPLMGGKGSDWEGGVRTPTFITGGFLPSAMRGRSLSGIVAVWDYFATFCGLAGISSVEPQESSPTPVDSFDMWQYFIGVVHESPRKELVHDHLMFTDNTSACIYRGYIQVAPCMGAGSIRSGDLKLFVGTHGKAANFGQFSPNSSWREDMLGIIRCSMEKPCLFNITADMEELSDLAAERPEAVKSMLERYHWYDSEFHPTSVPTPSEEDLQCEAALNNGGFQTPWHKDDSPVPLLPAWV